jgi:hypothetical protein
MKENSWELASPINEGLPELPEPSWWTKDLPTWRSLDWDTQRFAEKIYKIAEDNFEKNSIAEFDLYGWYS